MEKRKPLENIGNLVEISHKKTPAFLLVSSFISSIISVVGNSTVEL